MIISTVGRRHRSRVKELAARVIDVTPGSGDAEFSFTFDLWEAYRLRSRYQDWDTLFELAMWQNAIRHPANWLLMQNSPNIVLMDREPHACGGKETARAQTAIAMYKVLRAMGRKVQLGFEYSSEESKRSRAYA